MATARVFDGAIGAWIRLSLGLALTITFAGPVQGESGPIVTVDSGKLQGAAETGTSPIRIFRGIPFAAPPLADLRWREPQPVTQRATRTWRIGGLV